MDKDEQEWAEIHRAFAREMAASDEELRLKKNAAFNLFVDQIQGATTEQRKAYEGQYRQVADALLQSAIERDRIIIATSIRRKNELEERVRNAPTDIISPFWRVRVTGIMEESPSYLQHFFDRQLEIYSLETLREYFRFFLENADKTAQASPVEVEVFRVTREESAFALKGYEQEDRAIYHIDFRLPGQREIVGHDHVQNEIIGAWVTIGGQFVHRVTDYTREGRPIRHRDRIHRPIPREYTDGR